MTQADVAEVLELFGLPTDEDARRSMLRDMRDIEDTARRLRRSPLRPQDFSEVTALADASTAAQTILRSLLPPR